LLVTIAERLSSALRPGDTVARLGGDEFTVLAAGVNEGGAARLADRLLRTLDEPIEVDGRRVYARASIGVAVCAADGVDREPLRDADAAMYEAKRKGGQRYEIFSSDMHARVLDRLALECDLRDAELGSDITVHYQPLVDFRDGRLCGFEALLRWWHPERGMVPPLDFIPIAEETGLIVPIGLWVLREACAHAVAWSEAHPTNGPLGMNVNVSARQLTERTVVDDFGEVLVSTGLDPALLTIEITETMMMADEDEVRDCLQALKQLGLRVSVDDFGTGYSSLGHLRQFPVDELKIDRSFVASLGDGVGGSSVAAATIRLARSLHIDVVAEGIEREDQLNELRRSSCTKGQGYFLWKPMDAQAVDHLLANVNGSVLPPVAPERVLIVDDDDTVRQTVSRILTRAGFETIQAANGATALALAANTHLDAAVLDVHLPDVDGLALGRSLKQARDGTSLAVLHLSGSAVGLAERVHGLDSGADGYLVKPVVPGELVATLKASIRARADQRP
jgi:predicted signal transduction protein with EAL and GGDEF domain/ActR/RegA family two-component response regulator